MENPSLSVEITVEITLTQQSKARANDVIRQLKAQGSTRHAEGMARFGIQTSKALGVSLPQLRQIGRNLGQDHDLSLIHI